MDKRILHLTLIKQWFDLVASGRKLSEFRRIKPYWEKRFYKSICTKEFKDFDEIHFKNGYSKTAPSMRIELLGFGYKEFMGEQCFELRLGRVLELKHYKLDESKC